MRRAEGKEDYDAICCALLNMLQTSPAPQMKFAEPATAFAYISEAMESRKRVWIMGGYAIMVDIGNDWYSSKRYLIEQIILRITDDTSVKLDTVIRNGLSYLANYHSCCAIIVGDTQIGYMTPKYIANGYQPLGTQLIKEMPHGIRSQGLGG